MEIDTTVLAVTNSLFNKFPGNTKILKKVSTGDHFKKIYILHSWSEEWQVLFNMSKCKSLQLTAVIHTYRLGDQEITNEELEKTRGYKIY